MSENVKRYEELDANDRFAKTIVSLRRLRPFYSAIYEALERVESCDVPTMGVSTSKMIYNPKFVESIEFEELMFVSLHEIAHVALMHVSRRKDRDPILWNLAADLYVNKLLSEEFSIAPGMIDFTKTVKFLKDGIYCSTVDLDRDSTEDIYESLYEQAEDNGYNDYKFNGNEDAGKNGFDFSYTGSGDCDELSDEHKQFKITVVPSEYIKDIIDNGKDSLEQENENKKVLIDASIKTEMSGAGTEAGLLKFKVDEILESHVDWKKLLRKYCIHASRTDSSFSNPDKRMFYQRAIYPGQVNDEDGSLKGVKVCFDSSGSISEKDIAYFYGQVRDILRKFKVQAELIYWDTDVASAGNFMSVKEMLKITAAGRGGTNPACLFKYFDSKKCKVKPVVTLIFTDGFIVNELDNPKWKNKYKDTIWIMTKEHDEDFKPPFGKVTKAKFSD